MIKTIGVFLREQLLGMRWLNQLVGNLLQAIGIDLESRMGASVQFFIYDIIKIFYYFCKFRIAFLFNNSSVVFYSVSFQFYRIEIFANSIFVCSSHSLFLFIALRNASISSSRVFPLIFSMLYNLYVC